MSLSFSVGCIIDPVDCVSLHSFLGSNRPLLCVLCCNSLLALFAVGRIEVLSLVCEALLGFSMCRREGPSWSKRLRYRSYSWSFCIWIRSHRWLTRLWFSFPCSLLSLWLWIRGDVTRSPLCYSTHSVCRPFIELFHRTVGFAMCMIWILVIPQLK